jgi:hypothetical protein
MAILFFFLVDLHVPIDIFLQLRDLNAPPFLFFSDSHAPLQDTREERNQCT